jgi:Helicase associated domain/ROS/MUCR transcriptional regulator protein
MATDDGWTLPQEEPSWDGPFFGRFGVLATDPDGDVVQCHVCGNWYVLLGTHANAAHGLGADAYRRAFGLRRTTGLASPNYREKRRRISEHLVTPERLEAARAAAMALSADEMRRRSRMKRRRRQHEVETWTEPTRTQAALTARYGSPEGYPIEVLEGFANEFINELQNGQKGVYARLGDHWGVKWPTARSRVMAAVRRGALIWTGGDHTPDGYLPGSQPSEPPPGSFEQRLGLLHLWVQEHGSSHVPRRTVYEGAKLRSWMDSQRLRYRAGTLTQDQIDALEAVPGWWWRSAAPMGREGRPRPK